MKKFKQLLAAIVFIGVFFLPVNVNAATNIVKEDNSLMEFINSLFNQEANQHARSQIFTKQTLTLPMSISNSEKDLMARLVHAEAEGEPYTGKVAVATVILNRVDNKDFPDTIKGVIYQRNAFTPVQNGAINEAADQESVRAVEEALANRGQGHEALYFYNPETAKSDWILSREVTATIGQHRFAK